MSSIFASPMKWSPVTFIQLSVKWVLLVRLSANIHKTHHRQCWQFISDGIKTHLLLLLLLLLRSSSVHNAKIATKKNYQAKSVCKHNYPEGLFSFRHIYVSYTFRKGYSSKAQVVILWVVAHWLFVNGCWICP